MVWPKRLFFAAAILVLTAGCDSGESGFDLAVTGFVYTANGSIDPTDACGNPSRTSGLLTGLPNPYLGMSVFETDPDARVFRFVNLPGRIRIEIVRAYWHTTGPAPTERWVAGGLARVVPSTGKTIRVLEKDGSSRSLDWDLRDEAGDLVPSGFYRAFFTVDGSAALALELDGATVFDDLYIIQRTVPLDDLDPETGISIGDLNPAWRDPTGCL